MDLIINELKAQHSACLSTNQKSVIGSAAKGFIINKLVEQRNAYLSMNCKPVIGSATKNLIVLLVSSEK